MNVETQEWSTAAQSSHGRTPVTAGGMRSETPPARWKAVHQRTTTDTLLTNASAASAVAAAPSAKRRAAFLRECFMGRVSASERGSSPLRAE